MRVRCNQVCSTINDSHLTKNRFCFFQSHPPFPFVCIRQSVCSFSTGAYIQVDPLLLMVPHLQSLPQHKEAHVLPSAPPYTRACSTTKHLPVKPGKQYVKYASFANSGQKCFQKQQATQNARTKEAKARSVTLRVTTDIVLCILQFPTGRELGLCMIVQQPQDAITMGLRITMERDTYREQERKPTLLRGQHKVF